jgi:phosphoglycerate dehydrogenase-like enzyme
MLVPTKPTEEEADLVSLAWLPYADRAEAERRLGGIPAGLELDFYRADGEDFPSTIDEVAFYVLPYMRGPAVLERAAEMPKLQVVQTLTAGYEEFLPVVPPAVTLCNAAGLHDTSTAELAIALALASGRHLDEFARNQAEGAWKFAFGRALADQRALIVGYGHIGQAIERRLDGFEVASVTRVARSARPGTLMSPRVHPVGELHELLPEADVVFLIAPHTPQTEGLIGARELALLPDGALLVNVARGKLVDTDALVAELAQGRIRAALDVTDPEPLPADHPLWRQPGALISPHVGGASSAFFPRADRLMAAQLARFTAGQPLENIVKPPA